MDWHKTDAMKEHLDQFSLDMQQLNSLPAWVLSMPKSVERRASISKQLKTAGVLHEFIDAVDGQGDLPTEEVSGIPPLQLQDWITPARMTALSEFAGLCPGKCACRTTKHLQNKHAAPAGSSSRRERLAAAKLQGPPDQKACACELPAAASVAKHKLSPRAYVLNAIASLSLGLACKYIQRLLSLGDLIAQTSSTRRCF